MRFTLRRPTRFDLTLGGIAVVALLVRVVTAVKGGGQAPLAGDATVYRAVAENLANGKGFVDMIGRPTADHPPLWSLVLAAGDLVGLDGILSQRLIGGLIGAVTVVLVGLLGRRLRGDAVGLVAAGLAAIYPMLWTSDMTIMSETLYGCLLVGALLAATHRRPVILGILLGLTVLTRGEALALVALVVVPFFWRRWRQLAVSLVAFVAVLAPWTIRNSVTFVEPVFISTNSNGLWAGANCERTYYGDIVGSWAFECYSDRLPGEDESQAYARQRDQGMRYMKEHAGRVPTVMAIRFLRVVDMYDIDQSAFLNWTDGRPTRYSNLGVAAYYALLPFAVAGAVLLRRRWESLVVLLAPVVMVVAVAVITYGSTRFRFGAEPSIVILAAVALVAAGTRLLATPLGQRLRQRLGGLAAPRALSRRDPADATTPRR